MKQIKKCSYCKLYLSIREFQKHRSTLDGLRCWCRKCVALKKQQYKEKGAAKTKAYNWAYYNLNKQYFKDRYQGNKERYKTLGQIWREHNKDKNAKTSKAWRQKNNGLVTFYTIRRNKRIKQATPKWLTEEQLQALAEFYKNRPEGYHVDHIIPINGKTASGLHVPWNLQYLPAIENMRKHNKIEGKAA